MHLIQILFALPLLVFNYFLLEGEIFAPEVRSPVGLFPTLMLTDECIQRNGEMILRGEDRSPRRITCPNVTLSYTNPTWTLTGLEPDFCGAKSATNGLSHCTACPCFYSDSSYCGLTKYALSLPAFPQSFYNHGPESFPVCSKFSTIQ
jgi:hypothetical protein